MTAGIYINQPCDEQPPTWTQPYGYNLKLEGCYKGYDGRPPYLIFAGAGPKNCDSDPECDNTFRLKVECLPCDFPGPVCNVCATGRGPISFYTEKVGGEFTGDFAAYNGLWTLAAESMEAGCVWSLRCGDVSMELVLTGTYTDGFKATLTLMGASGGNLTYESTDSSTFQY